MKKIVSIVASILFSITVRCQNPVKWNFTAKKIDDKTYEIHLIPIVPTPWHIYSQTSPEGGALATKISFNKNPILVPDGKVAENGKIVSKYEEVFGVAVKYFEGEVDFVQRVKLKTKVKTNITGQIEFMACNDRQCLPPATVQFKIAL